VVRSRPSLVPRSAIPLVFVGGALGTAARALLEAAYGSSAGAWPWTTWGINVLGSFLLGVLAGALTGRGGSGLARQVRWSLGTGLVGGFTTYSTFVLEVHQLTTAGHAATAAGYTAASLVLGVAAAALGLTAGRRLDDGRSRGEEVRS